MTKEIRVNEKHKDRLFNFIFGQEENREWTLSLYNAINGSNYTDASLIEFNTLEGVLYMNMKNDTSFIISGIWNVYEHQSSFNPNMPYRMLEYIVELFSGYVKVNKLNKYVYLQKSIFSFLYLIFFSYYLLRNTKMKAILMHLCNYHLPMYQLILDKIQRIIIIV